MFFIKLDCVSVTRSGCVCGAILLDQRQMVGVNWNHTRYVGERLWPRVSNGCVENINFLSGLYLVGRHQ